MQRAIETIAQFVTTRAVKTRRNPSRLILISYFYAAQRLLLPLLHLSTIILVACTRRLGIRQVKVPRLLARAEAAYQCRRGRRLLDENKPEQSWRALEQCVKCSNNPFHFSTAGICLQVGLGRTREAIELHRQSNKIRRIERAAVSEGKYDRYCLLDSFWAVAIGHAATIDYVLKLRALEKHEPDDTILYVPPTIKVANQFLVEQWRGHLRLITDPRDLPFPENLVRYLALDFYVPSVNEPGKYIWWELASQTNRRWAEEGRKPLLTLTEDIRDRGRRVLAGAGVPPDAWFVGLHVREPGYQIHHRGLHGVLNARIEDYQPAIDEIVRRGGWVIRLGDPSMSPLPPLAKVLDYCHSPIRSDWMDVFLAATSRFFIGTSSGVCYVAQAYGVPCVLTNWWPPAQRPWHAGDIFIPKLLRQKGDGRALSLRQSLDEPFGYCNSARHLQEKHGIAVQDNDRADIRDAVVEMFERLEGKPNYDQDDLAMRQRAERIYRSEALRLYDSPGAFGVAAIARDFLGRNPALFDT